MQNKNKQHAKKNTKKTCKIKYKKNMQNKKIKTCKIKLKKHAK